METQELTPLLRNDQETIIALATPQGSGAIAVLRLSGLGAVAVADRIARLSNKKRLDERPGNTINHGFVVDQKSGKTIDEVLFLLMKAPKSFTGQDTVEISCHNNPFIIEQIMAAAITAGARQAKAGEFTMRAFLNGKVDLLQAEAINEVIHAPSEQALQLSMAQLQGSLSQHFVTIENGVLELLTLCEASFEFLEEEQRDFSFDDLVKGKFQNLRQQVQQTLSSFNQQKQIKEGVRIAIVGAVNAGKSSLFNELVGQQRAIVADVAGTTRDSIESVQYKHGHFWLIIDTAGLRQTGDTIEQLGIKRSYEEAALADVVLMVIDSSRPLTPEEGATYEQLYQAAGKKAIIVFSKSDAPTVTTTTPFILAPTTPICTISAAKREGIGALEQTIKKLTEQLFNLHSTPFLLTQRQYKLITEIDKKLDSIEKSFSDCIQYELMAYLCKDLLEKTSELTGKQISESILDTVFSSFCIGK